MRVHDFRPAPDNCDILATIQKLDLPFKSCQKILVIGIHSRKVLALSSTCCKIQGGGQPTISGILDSHNPLIPSSPFTDNFPTFIPRSVIYNY
jgi:hypothetical protein